MAPRQRSQTQSNAVDAFNALFCCHRSNRWRTYIGKALGIRACIAAIDRSSLEDKVATVMAGILSHLLPTNANYMRSIHSVPKAAGTIYGAIVIGLWIRFYTYNGGTRSLSMTSGGPPWSSISAYYIRHGAARGRGYLVNYLSIVTIVIVVLM
jgi:hypothetical protein